MVAALKKSLKAIRSSDTVDRAIRPALYDLKNIGAATAVSPRSKCGPHRKKHHECLQRKHQGVK